MIEHTIFTAPFAFSVSAICPCIKYKTRVFRMQERESERLSNWISNRQQLHENANDLLCYSRQMCILLGILSLNPIANEPFNLSGLYSSRCVVYYISVGFFFVYIRWLVGLTVGWLVFVAQLFILSYVCLIKCRK